jgi:serine/threonine protein kinase
VVLGVNKSTNVEYAIKIVDKEETNAKDMHKELHVMSKLNHANIVNYTETFDEPDGYYVVLELYACDDCDAMTLNWGSLFHPFFLFPFSFLRFFYVLSCLCFVCICSFSRLMCSITGGELFDRIIELQRYSEKDATRVLTQALLGL